MKKFSINLFLVAVMFIFGCAVNPEAPIQVDPENQAIIAQIAGRHAGAELVKENPEIAREVSALCEGILIANEDEILRVIVDRIVVVLSDELINDPLLVADIQDVIGMIKIKPDVIVITPEQLMVTKGAARGLISGIEIGGSK